MKIKLPKPKRKPKPHECAITGCDRPADSIVAWPDQYTKAWLCAKHAVLFIVDDPDDPPLFV